MGIEDETVRALDSAERRSQLGNQGRGTGVCGVHVKPETVASANDSDFGNGSTAVDDVVPIEATTQAGTSPCGPIRGDEAVELVRAERERGVGRQ